MQGTFPLLLVLFAGRRLLRQPPPVFRVLRRPGRARTLEKGPGCAPLRPVTFSSQALSNAASGRRSLPGRLRIPPDGGTDALKTSGDRGEAQAPVETTPVQEPVLLSRRL